MLILVVFVTHVYANQACRGVLSNEEKTAYHCLLDYS